MADEKSNVNGNENEEVNETVVDNEQGSKCECDAKCEGKCECEGKCDLDAKDEADDKKEASEEDKAAMLEKRYMALYAEYENFRKRTAKEREQLYSDAVAEVSEKWLAVLDNIDRAVESSKDLSADNYEQVAKGIEIIGKGAEDVLTKIGIKEIECQRGTAFDPNFHEAVMHVEDDELGEQEVAQVFQKGYIYKDRVVRHAVVQVAN